MQVMYKDYPVKLFFSRFGRRGKWHLILSTDTSLFYIKAMEQYQVLELMKIIIETLEIMLKILTRALPGLSIPVS